MLALSQHQKRRVLVVRVDDPNLQIDEKGRLIPGQHYVFGEATPDGDITLYYDSVRQHYEVRVVPCYITLQ